MAAEIMDVSGLSKYLKLAPITIYKMVKGGKLPHRRLGKSIRFPKVMIDRWLSQPEPPNPSPPTLRIPEAVKGAVSKFVKEVRKELGERVRDIRLYGSFARGEGRIDSDIDVAVIVDKRDITVTRTLRRIAAEISLEADRLLSIVILEDRSHQTGIAESYPLHRKIDQEGISL